MARKPLIGSDEEAIIKRRDGVAGEAFDEPLDAFGRRALSGSRLRALAFALGSARQAHEVEPIDDTELLAYLLDTLPEADHIALEKKLHGDASAFGRLMSLLLAFNSPTDPRDRQRAADRARKIGRHTAARIDVRRTGSSLQFRDATRPRPFFEGPRRSDDLTPGIELPMRARQLRRVLQAESAIGGGRRSSSRPPLKWGPKTEVILRSSLEQAQRDLSVGSSLVEQALLLLDRWRHIRRSEGSRSGPVESPIDPTAEQLRAQLGELLRKLEVVADRINDEFDNIASGTAGISPPDRFDEPEFAAHFELAQFSVHAAATPPLSLEPDPSWSDTFDVEAGPSSLHFASDTSGSTVQLAVSLRAEDSAVTPAEPFLTLVRPNEGFEAVNLDASGRGRIALPTGESVLLLQGEEVWEVRLSLRET